jgi:hypothetical protein
MNVSEMNDVVESIRGKLFRGEALKPEDLEQLNPLLNIDCSKDHYCSSAPVLLPYLNRSVVNGIMSTTTPGPQLVRYVGMVQDMLDPEYYVANDDQGRSTHFYDNFEENTGNRCGNAEETIIKTDQAATVIPPEDQYYSPTGSNGERSHHPDLAERIPLVVVPIPFPSEWFRQAIQPIIKNDIDPVIRASSPKSNLPNIRNKSEHLTSQHLLGKTLKTVAAAVATIGGREEVVEHLMRTVLFWPNFRMTCYCPNNK